MILMKLDWTNRFPSLRCRTFLACCNREV